MADRPESNQQLEKAWITIGRLQMRVEELEAELESAREPAAVPSTNPRPHGSPSLVDRPNYPPPLGEGTIPLTDHKDLLLRFQEKVNDYDSLLAKYHSLDQYAEKKRKDLDFLTDKYRKAREISRQWQEYSDKKRKKDLPQGPRNTPSSNTGTPTSSAIAHQAPEPVTEVAGLENNIQIRASHIPSRIDDACGETSRPHLRRFPSNRSTIASSPPVPRPQKRDCSSDAEPVFVSTRETSAKKRRRTKTNSPLRIVKLECNSPDGVVQLNSDDYSSPQRNHVLRQLSDLDALPTTRAEIPGAGNGITRSLQGAERVARATPSVSTIPPLFQGDGESSLLQAAPTTEELPRAALQPISANMTSSSGFTGSTTNGHGATSPRLLDKIKLVSEGCDVPARSGPKAVRKKTPNAAARRRLEDLLSDSPSDNPYRIQRVTPPVTNPQQRDAFQSMKNKPLHSLPITPLSEVRPLESSNRRSMASISHDHKTQPVERVPVEPARRAPEIRDPLRGRHKDELRLDDFKINPKYQDTDFAFADTLRGRDARRCLSGCTSPKCCGDEFRKAIEMGGASIMTKRSDADYLEAYLGANWQDVVGRYGVQRRKEVLKEAQTAAFANEFGKHRIAFARHSTPPGFWNTEMPNTQEQAEYRKIASQMEQQKIEERWREAQREGGRWIFRDGS